MRVRASQMRVRASQMRVRASQTRVRARGRTRHSVLTSSASTLDHVWLLLTVTLDHHVTHTIGDLNCYPGYPRPHVTHTIWYPHDLGCRVRMIKCTPTYKIRRFFIKTNDLNLQQHKYNYNIYCFICTSNIMILKKIYNNNI